jgi:hypothetical protein
MKKLRDYQVSIANEAVDILKTNKIVYLSVAVRCGKTLMSLETAKLYGAKNVLFLTKKKAMSSIESDYADFGYDKHFNITVINDESMHKLNDKYDLVIHDEHHRFGAFPKPGLATKTFRKMFYTLPHIYLSGTMSPESFSQIYHQYWVSAYSPFSKYTTFYKWAVDFVKIKQKHLGYGIVNDYSDADIVKIKEFTDKYTISYTQEEAGFKSKIDEETLFVKMKDSTYDMCNKLIKDLIIEGKEEVILADTSVKLMQKLHQMYSGTVKFESGKSMILDTSKAEFIKKRFEGKKIGIFYKFIEEYNALLQVFGGENLTNNVEEFDLTSKNIALQVVSGREGVSLKKAEFLVFYNIDFSATSYYQARDRMSSMDRLENKVYWIFSVDGIESKIYKSVMNKKNFTLTHFKKHYGTK